MSKQNGAEPHGWPNTETLKTRVGEFEFKNGYLTDNTAQRLRDLQTLNRATEIFSVIFFSVVCFSCLLRASGNQQ
jgi:hypothetical protein